MTTNVDHFLVVQLQGSAELKDPESQAPTRPEILYISVVVLDSATGQIDFDQFNSIVRPNVDPSEAVLKDTGLKQFKIDISDKWPAVLTKFETWMDSKGMIKQKNFMICTDGSATYETLLQSQAKISNTPIPSWMRKYINVRREVKSYHQPADETHRLHLDRMLEICQITPEHMGTATEYGRKRSCRDQAFNLALIVKDLIENKHEFGSPETVYD